MLRFIAFLADLADLADRRQASPMPRTLPAPVAVPVPPRYPDESGVYLILPR